MDESKTNSKRWLKRPLNPFATSRHLENLIHCIDCISNGCWTDIQFSSLRHYFWNVIHMTQVEVLQNLIIISWKLFREKVERQEGRLILLWKHSPVHKSILMLCNISYLSVVSRFVIRKLFLKIIEAFIKQTIPRVFKTLIQFSNTRGIVCFLPSGQVL